MITPSAANAKIQRPPSTSAPIPSSTAQSTPKSRAVFRPLKWRRPTDAPFVRIPQQGQRDQGPVRSRRSGLAADDREHLLTGDDLDPFAPVRLAEGLLVGVQQHPTGPLDVTDAPR